MKQQHPIGGQAVMEGVMMRDREYMIVACRHPDGDIRVIEEKLSPLAKKYPFLGWPFLRGVIVFFESMILAVKALNISSEQVLEAEGEEVSPIYTFISVVMGLMLGVGLFFLLPTFLIRYLPELFPVLLEYPVVLNLLEGLLRITIFVTYVYLISLWSEIQKVFAYHGAEHKAINCYEAGKDLDMKNAGDFNIKHPRCGTSFLFIVMIISILLFSFFGWPGLWMRFLTRIMLLPVIASLAYEVIRWTAVSKWKWVKVLSLPGIWMQGITTKEPDAGQVEVALAALKTLLSKSKEEKAGDVC